MKVRIEIDTKTFVRFWLVVIGFAFVILALYMSRAALAILLTAGFLALALNGPVTYLSKLIPGKSRIAATALAFTSVVVVLGLFVVMVVPPVVEQTAKFLESTPAIIDSAAKQWQGFGRLVDEYHIRPQVDAAVESLKADSTSWLTNLSKDILGSVGSLLAFIAVAFLTLVLSFLMLLEGPTWMRRIWSVYRDKKKMEAHRELVTRMRDVVSGYVTGQLAVAGIGGLCAGAAVYLISLFISAVPGNLALPAVAITFVLSLIPMFGATMAGILISLLLLINDVPAGIIFAIFFIIYQQIENNFIAPIVQAKYVRLSPLVVLASITVGLYLFGLAGGIISIPIAGCVKVLIETYLAKRDNKPVESDKPLAKLARRLKGQA